MVPKIFAAPDNVAACMLAERFGTQVANLRELDGASRAVAFSPSLAIAREVADAGGLIVLPALSGLAVQGAVLRHTPLLSEISRQKDSLKYRRRWTTIHAEAAWLADSDLAMVCAEWCDSPWTGERSLLGSEVLCADEVSGIFASALREAIDPCGFAARKFAEVDRDGDGEISREEFVAALVAIHATATEAERIFKKANHGRKIGAVCWGSGLEKILPQALAEVEVRFQADVLQGTAALGEVLRQGGEMERFENFVRQPARPEAGKSLRGTTTVAKWAKTRVLEWVAVQILPTHGVLVGHRAKVDGDDGLRTEFRSIDGRSAVLCRRMDQGFVEMWWENEVESEWVEYCRNNRERALGLDRQRLVAMRVRGLWGGLPEAEDFFLTGNPVSDWQLDVFRETGEFSLETATAQAPGDVVCRCTRATCGMIEEAMRRGATTIAEIAEKTGATSVCGSCQPVVEEFLGSESLHPARLVAKTFLGCGIWQLRFQIIDGRSVPVVPGQHILVQGHLTDRWVTRAYTLTSVGTAVQDLEICIKREEMGVFSRWLADVAQEHSLLKISEPRGDFLQDRTHLKTVFFAAGIGVTPAIALLRDPNLPGTPLALHWSAPSAAEMVFREELEATALGRPELSLAFRRTQTEGHLTPTEILSWAGEPGTADISLCGPPGFMRAVRSTLLSGGWEGTQIHEEAFLSRLDARGKARGPIAGESAGPIPVAEQETPFYQTERPISDEAELFLRQCYSEMGLGTALTSRLAEVREEISRTGTYTQTYDELVHGARLAWRNSNRCLGRRFWMNLEVRDMRHLDSEEDMFAAILDHIRASTNGGDLRATITVFRPDGRRIWNSQFFRYAGYLNRDGSLLGDPMNRMLTQQALELGWSPPSLRSRFDYLPIMIQRPGRNPKFFEIPQDLILEVPIFHPEYPHWDGLGLKWYGLPAVSDMVFDLGGIAYTAAPFNGFYMGTEVAARNFCDPDRYNLLPDIAAILGLNTQSERSLWRDRAIVEMNVAVLASFAARGVRMVDHHTLSNSLMEFVAEEHACQREVQADRQYMVPPLSPSTVPTFRATFDGNRFLKPNFFYQSPPNEVGPTAKCPFS
ncbi:MAG: nitric oxide synthase oxygenase [Terrimicrobiaceae bacterium]